MGTTSILIWISACSALILGIVAILTGKRRVVSTDTKEYTNIAGLIAWYTAYYADRISEVTRSENKKLVTGQVTGLLLATEHHRLLSTLIDTTDLHCRRSTANQETLHSHTRQLRILRYAQKKQERQGITIAEEISKVSELLKQIKDDLDRQAKERDEYESPTWRENGNNWTWGNWGTDQEGSSWGDSQNQDNNDEDQNHSSTVNDFERRIFGGSDTTSEGQPEPPNPPNTLDNPEERDQGETTSSPKEVSTELTSKDRTVCKTKRV